MGKRGRKRKERILKPLDLPISPDREHNFPSMRDEPLSDTLREYVDEKEEEDGIHENRPRNKGRKG